MSTTATEQSPSEALAAARKTLREAKGAELRARLKLPSDEMKRDYQIRESRTLRGVKEVEVDFDIEAEDLEDLGYHHKDQCSADPTELGSDASDRRALSDWHDKAHGLNLWANCPYEPCNLLSITYRETP